MHSGGQDQHAKRCLDVREGEDLTDLAIFAKDLPEGRFCNNPPLGLFSEYGWNERKIVNSNVLIKSYWEDETSVHICTGHTSLSQISSKVIKVQITDCFICTLGKK